MARNAVARSDRNYTAARRPSSGTRWTLRPTADDRACSEFCWPGGVFRFGPCHACSGMTCPSTGLTACCSKGHRPGGMLPGVTMDAGQRMSPAQAGSRDAAYCRRLRQALSQPILDCLDCSSIPETRDHATSLASRSVLALDASLSVPRSDQWTECVQDRKLRIHRDRVSASMFPSLNITLMSEM